MRANCYFFHTLRHFNPGKSSGEWLLIYMGMMQNSSPQYLPLIIKNIPFVCIVLPPRILVQNSYIKSVYTLTAFTYPYIYNISLTGECWWNNQPREHYNQ